MFCASRRVGTYCLWVRFYAFASSAGLIGIRIDPTGEEDPLPLLDVLANEWQVKEAGGRREVDRRVLGPPSSNRHETP